jgi:hypothetical protein
MLMILRCTRNSGDKEQQNCAKDANRQDTLLTPAASRGRPVENPNDELFEGLRCAADQIRKMEKELTGQAVGCTLASIGTVGVTTMVRLSDAIGWAIVSGVRVSRVRSP